MRWCRWLVALGLAACLDVGALQGGTTPVNDDAGADGSVDAIADGGVEGSREADAPTSYAVLGTGLEGITDIASDGKTLYFTIDTKPVGKVASCPSTGCPASGPKVLAPNEDGPARILFASGTVIWSSSTTGKVRTISPDGSKLVECGAGLVSARSFIAATGLLFYGQPNFIQWTPITACGNPTNHFLGSGPTAPAFAYDGQYMYFAYAQSPPTIEVRRCLSSFPSSSCMSAQEEKVLSATGDIESIAVDGAAVYALFRGSDGAVRTAASAPVDGGSTSTLASGLASPDSFFVDAAHVYVSLPTKVVRFSKTSPGAIETVLDGLSNPRGLLDETSTFLVAESTAGRILRVTKP
jgi:hypothetical protein